MNTEQPKPCGDPINECAPNRRKVLALGEAAALAALFPLSEAVAGPFEVDEFEKLIPPDKKFKPDWVASLTARGTPETFTGDDLVYIGMPVGGICAGTLYLGGDGRLWLWDVFNTIAEGIDPKTVRYEGQSVRSRDGSAYVVPPKQIRPVDQGFALRFKTATEERIVPLDRTGFRTVTFIGQHPIGTVNYRDDRVPLRAKLEAYSPFIPLNASDSGLPATITSFTLTNTSDAPVEATLAGWLENAVCLHHRTYSGTRRNRVTVGTGFTFLDCTAEDAGTSHLERQAVGRAAQRRRGDDAPQRLFDDREDPAGVHAQRLHEAGRQAVVAEVLHVTRSGPDECSRRRP